MTSRDVISRRAGHMAAWWRLHLMSAFLHLRRNVRQQYCAVVRPNLECKVREPADGEHGNDDDEHAHNAFPFVESFGAGS